MDGTFVCGIDGVELSKEVKLRRRLGRCRSRI